MSTSDEAPSRDIFKLFVTLVQRIGKDVNGEQAKIDSICERLLNGGSDPTSETYLRESATSDVGSDQPSMSHRRNKNPCKSCKKSRQKASLVHARVLEISETIVI